MFMATVAESDGVSLAEVAERGIKDLRIRLALKEIGSRKAQ